LDGHTPLHGGCSSGRLPPSPATRGSGRRGTRSTPTTGPVSAQQEADARYGDRAGTDAIRLTIRDALILQGFPPDYPVQGTRTAQFRQVGDAVPPPLAAAVIAALTGTTTARRAA